MPSTVAYFSHAPEFGSAERAHQALPYPAPFAGFADSVIAGQNGVGCFRTTNYAFGKFGFGSKFRRRSSSQTLCLVVAVVAVVVDFYISATL